jgi:cytochrome c
MRRSRIYLKSASWSLGVCAAALVLLGFRAPTSTPTLAPTPADSTRFTKKVLVEGLDEPFQIEFDIRGRVYWIERTSGNVKRFDESTGQVTLLGKIPTTVVAEGGLVGILLDKNFETSRLIYLDYSFVGDGGAVRESRISQFRLGADDRIDLSSEVVVLRWPVDTGGHMGGGMTWDAEGNMYVTVGDNTGAVQYAPYFFTNPGGASQDGQRAPGNTNDLRGKILRIHPEPDGTYTIPRGNLFPPGTPSTRPEIYTMGDRNPWRPSIDTRTGFLHWGEIGPDAGQDSAGVGPMGYDEFNIARGPGNFGWPFFIGYNRGYNRWDYAAQRFVEPQDPAHPINLSPNNTGLRELPPAQPAFIAYPYGGSAEYPFFGSGGRAAIGGPIFHRSNFKPDAQRLFPEEYEGRWFITDYVRNWIFTVTMDEGSTRAVSVERFMPNLTYLNPIDMDFGPEGDLYVVEYGRAGIGKISKIEYNAGNRPPQVTISADRTAGALPLRVALSSTGTVDYDQDPLRYEWVVAPEAGGTPQRFATANPTLTLTRAGAYRAVLTATDAKGAKGTAELRVMAGNEPPQVALSLTRGNRSFYFPGSSLQYGVKVSDREDGTPAPSAVAVTADFVPAGLNPADLPGVRALEADASARNLPAFAIMARSDCRSCHAEQTRLVGPSFREVAMKYRGDATALDRLATKIVAGGSGVWGDVPMPAHPALTPAEATTLARYVLALGDSSAAPQRLSLAGSFAVPAPAAGARPTNNPRVTQQGSYVLRATYTDKGANGVAPITSTDVVLLRQPRLAPEWADVTSGTMYAPSVGDPGFTVNRDGAYVGYRGIDLTGIASIEVGTLTRFYTWSHFKGGTVEVRLDSPTGRLLGAPVQVTPPTAPPAAPGAPAGGQRQGAPAAGAQPARPSNPSIPIFLGADLEKPVSIPVGGVTGTHDVYVVFRNPAAGPADALFLLTGVEFKPTAAAR